MECNSRRWRGTKHRTMQHTVLGSLCFCINLKPMDEENQKTNCSCFLFCKRVRTRHARFSQRSFFLSLFFISSIVTCAFLLLSFVPVCGRAVCTIAAQNTCMCERVSVCVDVVVAMCFAHWLSIYVARLVVMRSLIIVDRLRSAVVAFIVHFQIEFLTNVDHPLRIWPNTPYTHYRLLPPESESERERSKKGTRSPSRNL